MDLIRELQLLQFVVPDSLLDQVEQEFEKLPKTHENLFFYNEFRLANSGRLKKRRPQVLIGNRFMKTFPDIQSWPLFNVADVVCLTNLVNPLKCLGAINCDPSENFLEILKRLPPGFTPDFYWDNQVEYERQIHHGIEKAPFPILASVCHTFYHLTIEAIYSLFDKVLPLSPFFLNLYEKKFPGKSLNFPFGLNWASFNYMYNPEFENKPVDLSLTFGPRGDAPSGERRNRIVQKVLNFKEKYGHKYKITCSWDAPLEEYIVLLRQSRITINVVGLHGPYNYRALEAMALGAMVFQYDWDDGFFFNRFEGLFQDHVHGVSFTDETFEKKLLYYLEHPKEVEQIAKQAHTFVEENYSYQKLYQRLFDEVKKIQPKERKVINPIERIYFYQCDEKMMRLVGPGSVEIPWMQLNNQMVTAKNWEQAISYYKMGEVPPEFKWLFEWNYYQTCLQFHQVYSGPLKELLDEKLTPFDEERLFFKYPLDKKPFFLFNLELLKVIDDPKKRVEIYQELCRTLLPS